MKLPDLRRMFRRGEEQRAITGLPWDVGAPLSGRPVDDDAALSLVPVFAAVRLLATQVASLPMQAFRKTGDTRVKLPLPSLFTSPSVIGTQYDWLHRCVTSLALRGNAYGLITQRNALGYPTMIEWLHPDHVNVLDRALTGPGSFTQPIWFWLGRKIDKEDIVHIPWFTVPYRVKGLSPMEACAAAVSTGISAQDFTASWFQNGGVPPGTFKNVQKTVSQTEAAEIKARVTAAIRTRQPLVHGNDWEYAPIAVAAHEAKFIETQKLTATHIANIYGVPADQVGGDASASGLTYRNEANASLDFVKYTLRPWLELLEEKFSGLLPQPQFVKFNLDAILRADLPTRFAAYVEARNIGILSNNEIRALEDLPPVEGGDDHTPLLVQVAQSRGVDAAQVKADQPPATPVAPSTRLRAVVGYDFDAEEVPGIDAGPKGPMRGASAAVALEARRRDPSDPVAMERKFDPAEPRDPDGKWAHGGGVVHKLLKSLHESGNRDSAYFSDGDYMDWSTRDDRGGFSLEVGDSHDTVQLDLSPEDMANLHEGLTKSLRDDSSDGIATDKGHTGLDWFPQDDGQQWEFVATDADGNEVTFDWSRSRMERLHHALTLTLLTDAIGQPDGEGRALALARSLVEVRAAGHDTTPGHDELHHYWTKGPGLAKWVDSPKPWTTLVAHLTKYVGPEKAKVYASRWFIEVFGYAAGSDKNRVAHGHPPRGHKVGPG